MHIHSLKFAIVEVIVICVSLFSIVIFLGDISINNDRTETFWPILYTGRKAQKGESGAFLWKLRDELKEALMETDLSKVKLPNS